MNILIVIENYLPNIGGVEIVFKNLSEGLAKKSHNVEIITHQYPKTKKFEIINKVKIHRIPCLNSRYLFTFLSIPKVLKHAKKADIIHTTTYNGAFPAWLASKIKNKPAIITVHEILGKDWSRLLGMNAINAFLHRFLEWLIIKLNFDYYISVSNSTKNNILKYQVSKNRVKTIYNGIDYKLFKPQKKDTELKNKLKIKNEFIYMSFGRPGITKGIEYLVQAVPIITKKIPDSKLLLILSKTDRYSHIIGLIKKLKIKNQIILLDPIKDRKELIKHIALADCVVVPSLTEGFGFTAAEACAMNKPVVASNTTSLPEVVSGKYVLVKPRSPKSIANAVELVYKGKVKAKPKKIFRWEDSIKSYLDTYKKLIKKQKTI